MPTALRLPHFIIAGAPRAGTTWLCSLLERHPDIGLAQPIAPEPKFFLVDALYERGLAYYARRWFADLPEAVLGEKSTNYLENPRCAARIRAHLPDVRLIFMLRDPVERAWSNYRWSRTNGHETADFDSALALAGRRETPDALRYARPYDYLSRGHYARLLRPYLELFDPARILLLRHEDVVEAPQDLAARVHAYLGVTPRPGDAANLPPVNAAEPGRMSATARRFLVNYYAAPNRDLAAQTGFDISGWTKEDPA